MTTFNEEHLISTDKPGYGIRRFSQGLVCLTVFLFLIYPSTVQAFFSSEKESSNQVRINTTFYEKPYILAQGVDPDHESTPYPDDPQESFPQPGPTDPGDEPMPNPDDPQESFPEPRTNS